MIGGLSAISVVLGGAIAVAANRYPQRQQVMEFLAGVLLIVGFAMLGYALESVIGPPPAAQSFRAVLMKCCLYGTCRTPDHDNGRRGCCRQAFSASSFTYWAFSCVSRDHAGRDL
jgi:hypothetical protein